MTLWKDKILQKVNIKHLSFVLPIIKRDNALFLITLTALLFYCCGQPEIKNSDNPPINTSNRVQNNIEDIRIDSVRNAVLHRNSETIAVFAEKDFFNNLRGVDREYKENNYSTLKNILHKHHISIYDLYIELSSGYATVKQEARRRYIEIRPDGNERITNNYYDFIKHGNNSIELNFQEKYGISNRLFVCIKNNYCSCVGDHSDKYCNGKKCKLIYGEYWD